MLLTFFTQLSLQKLNRMYYGSKNRATGSK
ncbi:MAG: hypothetical protein RIR31_1998, partial [Bacteroidota bacterium]